MTINHNNKYKILLVNDHTANLGIGKYFFNLFNEFLQINRNGDSFYLLMQNMGKHYTSTTENTNIQYRKTWAKQRGFGKMYDVMAYYYYPKRIPAGFSLYHISSQMMGNSANFVSPSVVTCHDLIPYQVKSNHPKFNQYLRRKQISALTNASAIIFISEHTKSNFLSIFDYKEDNTAIIYHAASENFHPRDKLVSRRELGLPLDRPIILHVGSNASRKNIYTLFHIVCNLKKQTPDILLIRIGLQRKRAQILAEKLGIDKNILYFKSLSENTLAKFYNAADVFVFPSLFEGFGLPALEAMKSGCPLVASNATSIPEVTGDAAILHHPLDIDNFVDSIETILDNPMIREEYIKKGIERSTHFTWRNTAQKTLEIYRRILGC